MCPLECYLKTHEFMCVYKFTLSFTLYIQFVFQHVRMEAHAMAHLPLLTVSVPVAPQEATASIQVY